MIKPHVLCLPHQQASSDSFKAVNAPDAEEPTIRISQDREGELIELDASDWTADALSMALRDVLAQTVEGVSLWLDNPAEDTDETLARLGWNLNGTSFGWSAQFLSSKGLILTRGPLSQRKTKRSGVK